MLLTKELEQHFRDVYNPEGSNLRKAQLRMVDMLLWFDNVMKKHNIEWFLEGGTLLGAVRHGGFIPWDDDIDIGIHIKDAKRVHDILMLEKHPQYVFQCKKTDPHCFYQWNTIRDTHSKYIHTQPYMIKLESLRKYTGVQIDIFPFDNHVNIKWNRVLGWRSWGHTIICKCGISKVSLLVARIFHCLQMGIIRLSQLLTKKKNYWTNSYGVCFGNGYSYPDGVRGGRGYIYPDGTLFPTSTVMFEGHEFPAPHDPDVFLRCHYGDYMQLPEDSEFNHHNLSQIEIY